MRQEKRIENLNAKQAKDPNGYVKAMDYALAYALGAKIKIRQSNI